METFYGIYLKQVQYCFKQVPIYIQSLNKDVKHILLSTAI